MEGAGVMVMMRGLPQVGVRAEGPTSLVMVRWWREVSGLPVLRGCCRAPKLCVVPPGKDVPCDLHVMHPNEVRDERDNDC